MPCLLSKENGKEMAMQVGIAEIVDLWQSEVNSKLHLQFLNVILKFSE